MWEVWEVFAQKLYLGVKNMFFFYFDLTGVPHVNAITMLGMPQVIQGIPVDIH